jgi:hypothetical protein
VPFHHDSSLFANNGPSCSRRKNAILLSARYTSCLLDCIMLLHQ